MENNDYGYLIKNADIYAPKQLGINDILIINDKIIKIDKNITFEADFIKTIDIKGKKIIPGIIDQHIHIVGGGGEGGFASRVPDIKISELIKAGITTLVGILGTDSVTKDIKSLVAKTKEIKHFGLNAYCLTGAYDYPSPSLLNTIKEDIVFIEEIIGAKLALADHRSSHVTKQELLRLASQIRTARLISNKNAYLKLHFGSEASGFKLVNEILKETDIPIDIFRPTHISRTKELLSEALDFASRGGYIDFTVKPNNDFINKIRYILKTKPPLEKITFSSDALGSWSTYKNGELERIGYSPANAIIKTISKLVNKDILPLTKALTFATTNIAKALDLKDRGEIKTANFADILVIDNNFDIIYMLANGKMLIDNKNILVKGYYES
ncbi:MAG: beta-aspartyl-peptidase [Bacillota bacterium]